MNKIVMKPRDLREQALMENAIAQAETNKANLDYISMMSGIEIPTEEEVNENAAQSEV